MSLGLNRGFAEWFMGGWDRTLPVPVTGQRCNRCVLSGPPYGQLARRQTDLHHNSPRLAITCLPIPTRMCRWGSGRLHAGLCRCAVWDWMHEGSKVAELVPKDVSNATCAIKPIVAPPAVPRKLSEHSQYQIQKAMPAKA